MKRESKINTRTGRAALASRTAPYYRNISKGLAVGYYRGAKGTTWVARHFSSGKMRKTALGLTDDIQDADGVRVLSFDQAQKAAQDWLNRLMQEDTGEMIGGSYTVADACRDYLKHLVKVKRKPQGSTQAIVNAHILPTLGTIELAKLRHGKLTAWRNALAEAAPRKRTKVGKPQAYRTIDFENPDALRRRQATVNRILTVLKAALNHAKSDSRRVASDAAWIDVKPFAKVDVPKVRFLTADEVTALVKNCEPDFQSLVKGALLTGCRYGELTALAVADFNSKDGQVYIAESKNGESRYVDLNATGVAFFTQLTEGRKPLERVFVKAIGKPWKMSEQFRPMNAACDAAKIEGVTFHILRHTYASHALMAGMTIEVLAQQLGHKDTRITMRHYAHLCPTFKQESVRQNAPSFGFTDDAKPFLVKTSA